MRPVILIPGMGGSMLVKQSQVGPDKSVRITNRWQNVNIMQSIRHAEQWKIDMQLHFDYDEHKRITGVRDALHSGVEVHDFGGTLGIKRLLPELDYIPEFWKNQLNEQCNFQYFDTMCNELYTRGYEDHVSLFGIPYDFRLILDPLARAELFRKTKALIESIDQKCVIVSHSLGGIMFKWFLSTFVDESWIHEHIHGWVCVSAPFGGTTEALVPCIHGYHYLKPFRDKFRDNLAQNNGLVMCFPNKIAFGTGDPIAKFVNEFITIDDYASLSDQNMLPFKVWTDLYKPHMEHIAKKLSVPVHIVYSDNVATNNIPCFDKNGHLTRYHECCPGDNIILSRCLKAYEGLFNHNAVQETIIPNTKHSNIIRHPKLLEIVFQFADPLA